MGPWRPHETLYDLGSLISVENPPNAGRNTCPRLGSAGAPVLGAPSAPSMAREPRCPTSSVQPHLSVKPHLFDPPPPFRRRPAASAVQVLADDLIAPRGQTFSGTSCTSAAPMDVRCPSVLARSQANEWAEYLLLTWESFSLSRGLHCCPLDLQSFEVELLSSSDLCVHWLEWCIRLHWALEVRADWRSWERLIGRDHQEKSYQHSLRAIAFESWLSSHLFVVELEWSWEVDSSCCIVEEQLIVLLVVDV